MATHAVRNGFRMESYAHPGAVRWTSRWVKRLHPEHVASVLASDRRRRITGRSARSSESQRKVSDSSEKRFDPYHKWLGIPPEDQPPHHYRLLGVPLYEDDAAVIESAADRQMT